MATPFHHSGVGGADIFLDAIMPPTPGFALLQVSLWKSEYDKASGTYHIDYSRMSFSLYSSGSSSMRRIRAFLCLTQETVYHRAAASLDIRINYGNVIREVR